MFNQPILDEEAKIYNKEFYSKNDESNPSDAYHRAEEPKNKRDKDGKPFIKCAFYLIFAVLVIMAINAVINAASRVDLNYDN